MEIYLKGNNSGIKVKAHLQHELLLTKSPLKKKLNKAFKSSFSNHRELPINTLMMVKWHLVWGTHRLYSLPRHLGILSLVKFTNKTSPQRCLLSKTRDLNEITCKVPGVSKHAVIPSECVSGCRHLNVCVMNYGVISLDMRKGVIKGKDSGQGMMKVQNFPEKLKFSFSIFVL